MSSDLFQNKYRISSTRLQEWNYANQGIYFITICTANKQCYLGKIIDKQMQLSELGKIAQNEWVKSIELRPDMNMQLSEFRVMPNHFHAIIIIGNNTYNNGHINRRDAMHGVSTNITPNDFGDTTHPLSTITTNNPPDAKHGVSTKNIPTIPGDAKHGVSTKFGIQSKNLASVIRGYKSAVTTYARKNNIPFEWQPRFHDHIIRSIDEHNSISSYILNNPANWQKDKFYI